VTAVGAQDRRSVLAQLIADLGLHHICALAREQMHRRAAEAHLFVLDRIRRAGQQRYPAL